jgi:hypothetical protein
MLKDIVLIIQGVPATFVFCDFDLKSKETNNDIPDFDVQ